MRGSLELNMMKTQVYLYTEKKWLLKETFTFRNFSQISSHFTYSIPPPPPHYFQWLFIPQPPGPPKRPHLCWPTWGLTLPLTQSEQSTPNLIPHHFSKRCRWYCFIKLGAVGDLWKPPDTWPADIPLPRSHHMSAVEQHPVRHTLYTGPAESPL